MTSSPPRVALVMHRLAPSAPTGTVRYALELAGAFARDPAASGYVIASLPGSISGAPLPVEEIRGNRQLTQLGWFGLKRPLLESRLARPDLVHVLSPFAPVPSRMPVVYTVHDLLPLWHADWFALSHRLKIRTTFRRIADEAAHVITDSHHVAADVSSHLGIDPSRVTTVHLGVSPRFAEPSSPEKQAAVCGRLGVEPRRFFVAIGAISPRKNLAVVVRALARTALDDHALVLAGPPGHDADAVVRAVSASGLGDRVRMPGLVDDDDLAALLQGATALVHPALSEGFGLTPLEAMAARTPAIVSNGGSLPEVVGDAALVAEPTDVDAWAAAMQRVADDEDLRANLVARGAAHVREFTWGRAAQATIAVHQRVLGATTT